MLPRHIEDFARSFLADNRLAALACEAGEVIPPREVIELSAQVQGLYFALHLHCQGLEEIRQYQKLWLEAAKFYESACGIWAEVPLDGELLFYHRALLVHLRDLCADRAQLYSVCAADRALYRSRKEESGPREVGVS
jgi:hypothetical protein